MDVDFSLTAIAPPLEGQRGVFGGRRPKASKGGNRAGGRRKAPRARAKSGSNACTTLRGPLGSPMGI